MDFYYFDASVLVKAYVWEVGTEDVRRVLRSARAASPTARIITSSIAYAETMSAVSRREAAGQLTAREAAEIESRMRADFIGPVLPYVILDPGRPMVHHAADVARQHRLRARMPSTSRRRSPRASTPRLASASISVPRISG